MEDMKLVSITLRTNGTIADAINTYTTMGVPLSQLLTDYNDVITYPDLLETAVNPWESIHIRKGTPVVCGVSAAETLFNVSAMSLYRQNPISVIKSIYYRNKNRNDSALERVFLSLVQDSIAADQRVLIINPSPFVVESVEKNGRNTAYAVIDKTMASLYSKQFKRSDVVSIENIHNVAGADVMIIFTTNIDEKSLRKIMEYVGTVRVERIYGIIQTRLIDNKESLFWQALSAGHYVIRGMVILPNEASNSTPRKKCLISIESKKKDLVLEQELTVQKMEYNSSEKTVSLADHKMIVRQEELMNCKTLNQLWKMASNEESGEDKEDKEVKGKKESDYTSADLYAFSREIQISYALYRGHNGCYAKAYYAATKYPHLPEVRGKALTTRVERGLRAKTASQVIDALEKVPYSKSMSEAITADIIKNYLKTGESVTLKTLWFCLRNELQKNTSYDDDTMEVLFSRGTAISDLYPGRDRGDAFRKAIEEQLEEGEEVKELRLLKLVNLVITEAVKQGYLSENRILPLISAAQNRATKRQAEVRQALTKRSFETAEEQRIVKYLLPLCVKSSIYLSALIRLMTGITIREVCGLQWSDFHYDDKIDIYTLSVTKFVDSNGKVIHHVVEENWEKYRILPISALLGRILKARKNYLKKEELDDQTLEEYPIILPREDLAHMRKGHKPVYCKPAAVAEKCRKAVEVAEIPQFPIILPGKDGNDIETDINSYNGDIFRTNFRDKALNVAGFELDELNYYLGLKKPDTFSQHYCDYTNPYVQLIMARKLDRWLVCYDSRKQADYQRSTATGTIKGIGDGVPYAEIEAARGVTASGANGSEPITIHVESTHGFKIAISSYDQRKQLCEDP